MINFKETSPTLTREFSLISHTLLNSRNYRKSHPSNGSGSAHVRVYTAGSKFSRNYINQKFLLRVVLALATSCSSVNTIIARTRSLSAKRRVGADEIRWLKCLSFDGVFVNGTDCNWIAVFGRKLQTRAQNRITVRTANFYWEYSSVAFVKTIPIALEVLLVNIDVFA